MLRILSIDGGGIRGIVPAVVLSELERRTGRPVHELFDLIAGTSTGGILALALTKPGSDGRAQYPASSLIELYEQEGPRIFSRPAWHRLYALNNLMEEKFPASGLQEVLERYLGDVRLKDALTDVLVTSYEIERRLPFFFRSQRARADASYDFPMALVARATSAAPTYFEPAMIRVADSSDYYSLIDGGVFANNPAMCAYVEALDVHRPGPDDEIVVLSLGTGELTRRIAHEEASGWGLMMWARPILDVVFDGVSDTVDHQLRQLCREAGQRSRRYYRFQPILNDVNDDMDDVSRGNVRALRLLGERLVDAHDQDLDNVCKLLAGAA